MIEARVETFVLLLMAACAVALLVKAVPVPYVSALALVGLLGGLLLGPGQLQLTHSLIRAASRAALRSRLQPELERAQGQPGRGCGAGDAGSRSDHGSYLLAESFHLSGILAVVAAGLVLGNLGKPRAMSQQTQDAVNLFWYDVAFLLNSVVFLLVGLDVPWAEVRTQLGVIVAAALIALLARAVAVYLGLLHPLPWRISPRWQHLVVWSGLRGAIASPWLSA